MSQANDVRIKGVPVTLADGHEYELIFDMNAMIELEEKFGAIETAMQSLSEGKIKPMRTILWAGLCHSDAALTEVQVGRLITMDIFQEVTMKLAEAFEKFMPANEDVDEAQIALGDQEVSNPS
jgi:hypothetical protein